MTAAARGDEAHEQPISAPEAASPEVTERADNGQKPKTTLPRIAAGGFKLPPSSLLHRPDEQRAIDADELKLLAQVLIEKGKQHRGNIEEPSEFLPLIGPESWFPSCDKGSTSVLRFDAHFRAVGMGLPLARLVLQLLG